MMKKKNKVVVTRSWDFSGVYVERNNVTDWKKNLYYVAGVNTNDMYGWNDYVVLNHWFKLYEWFENLLGVYKLNRYWSKR